jgi:hypothetical protein
MASPIVSIEFGGEDVVVRRIRTDNLLTDLEVVIARQQLMVVRIDVPSFELKFKRTEQSGTVDRAMGWESDAAFASIFISTTAAVPGGFIDIWCQNACGGTRMIVP